MVYISMMFKIHYCIVFHYCHLLVEKSLMSVPFEVDTFCTCIYLSSSVLWPTGQVPTLYKLLSQWFRLGSQVLCAQTTRSLPWPPTGARLQLRVGGTMPTRQLLPLILTLLDFKNENFLLNTLALTTTLYLILLNNALIFI